MPYCIEDTPQGYQKNNDQAADKTDGFLNKFYEHFHDAHSIKCFLVLVNRFYELSTVLNISRLGLQNRQAQERRIIVIMVK